jgi:hypothetical protein
MAHRREGTGPYLIESVSSPTPVPAREVTIPPALTGNNEDMNDDNEVETKPAAVDGQDQAPDVVSDPAKDDTEGQDWSDEGGATSSGPATNDEVSAS